MKKTVCILLALICIFMGLCGCTSANENTAAADNNITRSEYTQSTAAEADTKDDAVSDTKDDTVSDTSTTQAVSEAPATSAAKAVSKASNSAVTTKQNTTAEKSTAKNKEKTSTASDKKSASKTTESRTVNTTKAYTCTLSIECSSILDNLDNLNADKLDIVPANGIIFAAQKVEFYEGESVFDVLQRVCKENKIHMESSWTPMYNSAYVEGIGNLYEFDCGSGSGWMYRVNGWYPNYGCSRYTLKQGDKVEWRYTCNLGKDIGG